MNRHSLPSRYSALVSFAQEFVRAMGISYFAGINLSKL